MDVHQFETLIAGLTGEIADQALGPALQERLNAAHGPGSPMYEAIFAACQAGVEAGWMCDREGGGIRYGRVLKRPALPTAFRSTWSTCKTSLVRTMRIRMARST